MRAYTHEQVLTLIGSAVAQAEMNIYADLRGADNETRLNSLDTLDALHLVQTQLVALIDNQTYFEETSNDE